MNPLSKQDALQVARFAFDHADDGALWMDREGQLLYANPTACRELGYSAEELLTLTLFQVSSELSPELWAQLWKEVHARESFRFEFTLRSKENRMLPIEMTVHQGPLPNLPLLCAFFRNVNDLKRLQQLKNEFVSTVSHELRTPMTIIRESVSQILDGLLGDVPPVQKEALYVTLSGIDRLARIINDLLDVSKMEAGKTTLRWDRVNLVELIREIVETFTPRARERGLTLKTRIPDREIIVYADYDRLAQVFTNLVGNALKFMEKGHIEFSITEFETHFECAIADTGLGIAKEDLGRVFNKFEQLSQPAITGEKGSGLGLSICKGIIELHQGRIWAESKKGEGSTFFFTLPKRTAEELFKQRLGAELTHAVATDGHLTALRFEIQIAAQTDMRKKATLSGWALQELSETLRLQGVRKTDFVLRDAQGIWILLFGISQKEGQRIVNQILDAYAAELGKSEYVEEVQLTWKACSYPKDAQTLPEIMKQLHPGKRKHAA